MSPRIESYMVSSKGSAACTPLIKTIGVRVSCATGAIAVSFVFLDCKNPQPRAAALQNRTKDILCRMALDD
jgi:hypothetical protein